MYINFNTKQDYWGFWSTLAAERRHPEATARTLKVQILREGHGIWKNLPPVMTKQLFSLSSVKTSGIFFQIFVTFSEKLNIKKKTWYLPVVQVPKALQGWYCVVPWLPLLVISCIPWHFSSHEGCSWNPSWWAEPAVGAALRNLEYEFSSEILDQVQKKMSLFLQNEWNSF